MADDIAPVAKLAIPLADKLAMLREAAAETGAGNASLIAWAAAHPAIASGSDWMARAWWGAAAGEVVRDYLYDPGRRGAALGLVEHVASGPLVEALSQGRGVIILTAHFGPPKFLMNWLIDQDLPLLVWTNMRDLPAWVASSSRAKLVDPRSPDRKSVTLVNSALHLRRKGVLLGAADMATGDRLVTIERYGFVRRFSVGLPTLARRLDVPTVVGLALWKGDRVAIEFSRLESPDTSLPESDWTTQWLERSWSCMEPILMESPENLRFLKSAVGQIAKPWERTTG